MHRQLIRSRIRSILLILAAGIPAHAQSDPPAAESAPASSPAGIRRALVVCGLPGDGDHRKLFADSLETLYTGLTEHHGFAVENVHVLWGDEPSESDGQAVRSSRGQTTRETLTQTAAALRESLAQEDALWVFVIGHVHFDRRYSWLNIAGDDIQHLEFGQLFQGLPAREQVFFVTTPCSGFYLKSLAMPGRVVVTATEPDLEVNETLFPHKLALALGNPPAYEELEADKDGRLTLFDVYLWTARQVAQEYLTGELLATEHALLDDNGDGRGTEVQIDYLSEELGGRLRAGQDLPARPKGDGLRSCEIVLSWPAPGSPAPATPAPATPDPNGPAPADPAPAAPDPNEPAPAAPAPAAPDPNAAPGTSSDPPEEQKPQEPSGDA